MSSLLCYRSLAVQQRLSFIWHLTLRLPQFDRTLRVCAFNKAYVDSLLEEKRYTEVIYVVASYDLCGKDVCRFCVFTIFIFVADLLLF